MSNVQPIEQARFWDEFLKRDISFLSEHDEASLFAELYATCRRYADLIRGGRVLEIGCGDGMDAIALSLEYGAEVVAIDISPARVELANQNIARFGTAAKVSAQIGDAHALPFPDASFDAVLGNSVMLFLDHDRALKELSRALRPGGRLILANESLAMSPLARLSRAVSLGYKSGELESHVNQRISPEEIEELASRYFSDVTFELHFGVALQMLWGARLVLDKVKSKFTKIDTYHKPDVKVPGWLRKLDRGLIDRWGMYRDRTWIAAVCFTK